MKAFLFLFIGLSLSATVYGAKKTGIDCESGDNPYELAGLLSAQWSEGKGSIMVSDAGTKIKGDLVSASGITTTQRKEGDYIVCAVVTIDAE